MSDDISRSERMRQFLADHYGQWVTVDQFCEFAPDLTPGEHGSRKRAVTAFRNHRRRDDEWETQRRQPGDKSVTREFRCVDLPEEYQQVEEADVSLQSGTKQHRALELLRLHFVDEQYPSHVQSRTLREVDPDEHKYGFGAELTELKAKGLVNHDGDSHTWGISKQGMILIQSVDGMDIDTGAIEEAWSKREGTETTANK